MYTRTFSAKIPRFQLPCTGILIFLIGSFIFSTPACAFYSWPDGENQFFKWENGGSQNGRFGTPTISGTTFQFSDLDFLAETNSGFVKVDDVLRFDLIAKSNYKILGLKISEYGEYGITGTGRVSASGKITVTNLDQWQEETDLFAISPGTSITSGSGNWSGTAEVDMAPGWSRVQVIITNNLIAISQGSYVFIEKTEFGTSQGVNIEILIPEPATLTIFALGSLVFLASKKRPGKFIFAFLLICLSYICTSNADAASWTNDNGAGVNFTWQNGQSVNGLFDNPRLDGLGNTFIFAPPAFESSSFSDSLLVMDTLEFELIAAPGYIITQINIHESGEYLLLGNGFINVTGQLTITDLDTELTSNTLMELTPGMPVISEGYNEWSGLAVITGLNSSRIRVSVSSSLFTSADDGSYALVRKTAFNIPVTLQLIPEPATVALLALGSIIFIGKKRK